jgi:hypothetical protein
MGFRRHRKYGVRPVLQWTCSRARVGATPASRWCSVCWAMDRMGAIGVQCRGQRQQRLQLFKASGWRGRFVFNSWYIYRVLVGSFGNSPRWSQNRVPSPNLLTTAARALHWQRVVAFSGSSSLHVLALGAQPAKVS